MIPITCGFAGLLLLLIAVIWGLFSHRRIKQLTAMARYASHEISTPLYAGRAGAQVLVKCLEGRPGMDTEVRIARNILTAADMAFETIAAFRNMARTPLGTAGEVVSTHLDADLALKTVLLSLEELLRVTTISVITQIEPTRTRSISATDFSLIARHLLRNAVQAVIEGTVPPNAEKEITVKLYRDEKHPRSVLEISDNGPGMDARTRRNCTRLSISDDGQSRGIGLFVVARTVEKNRLKLQIESQRGAGSTFRIFFPSDTPV